MLRTEKNDSIFLLVIILFAILSCFLTLPLPSVGEEGVYTNITLEMLYNNNYLVPKLYGTQYSRPPLFNWLMLPLVKLLGVIHVTVAARLVNILATIASAGLLFWFTKHVFKQKNLAFLATAIFLSGDLLLMRSWLAYADSLFAFCIFAAIVCLWLALESKRKIFWLGVFLALSAGFLTKVYTVYVFYALSAVVLLFYNQNRNYILKPASIIMHVLALAVPVCWTLSLNHNAVTTSVLYSRSFFVWASIGGYIYKILIGFPITVFIRFLPASAIALLSGYPVYKQKKLVPLAVKTIFWIVILNLLPYWLAPISNIRYVLPLYPLIALLIAYVISQASRRLQRLTFILLFIAIVAKYLISIFWLPYEHTVLRGNAPAAASEINQVINNADLYINDSSSTGLRVAVELNKLRPSKPPLTVAPHDFTGYVLTDQKDANLGVLIQKYTFNNNKLYLFFNAGSS